ncbi:hypothetical protein XENOCAPTIV_029692 [Xenoophorus captivus]|uniref:MTMR6-9 GRAM domain-containing protein n=1 Tax=Xenoophorus captivus TaxID=1517983 RepID=A0ABV0Q6V5_9TELE
MMDSITGQYWSSSGGEYSSVENVRLLDRSSSQRKASVGTLYLSATHTIFIENNPETRKETWVLHSMVCSVERPPATPSGSQLILRCKDFRVFQVLIPQERACLDVHASLVRLSRPEKYSELYCLSFNPNVNKEEREESWNFIDLQADYKRMGVPNNLWVSTLANSEYRVSVSVHVKDWTNWVMFNFSEIK